MRTLQKILGNIGIPYFSKLIYKIFEGTSAKTGDCSKNYGISNREILIEYYGFEPCCDIEKKRNSTQIFDRRAIGVKQYRSASIAVVKSFDRLVKRGFVRRKHNYGILLTEAGIKSAKAIDLELICNKEKAKFV